jgi:hypothetical protein
MNSLRKKVNKNFQSAHQYVHRWGYLIFLVMIVYVSFLTVFFAADFALAYSFFAKLAENAIGDVPTEMKFVVALKAMLAVAAAVVVKTTFSKMPNWVQFFITIILLIGSVIIITKMGRAQITPLKIESLERIFHNEFDIRPELSGLFDDESVAGNSDYSQEMTPDAKEAISPGRYIQEFQYYGYAYLMMTFAGVFVWRVLSELYIRMQKLNQVNKAFLARHKKLIKKERILRQAIESKEYLELYDNLIYRGAQDIIIDAYYYGLVVLKRQVRHLKIYGDENGELQKKYSYLQTFRVGRIAMLNIEKTEDLIQLADASLLNLNLIDTNYDSALNTINCTIKTN